MLFVLSLKMLEGLPQVVVGMTKLECGEFKWVNASIFLKWPRKPAMCVHFFYAIAMWCTANG